MLAVREKVNLTPFLPLVYYCAMNFWKLVKELRRRRVFRVAGIYLIGAWVWLQVMDVIAEPAGLPAWSMTLLLYVEVLLFPVAVFLGLR